MDALSVEAFEGAAGTGKTHSLMVAMEQRLQDIPLDEGQRVLALTFMHGSRQRLTARMRCLVSLQGHFDCMTIDSLAWHLACRWRGLLAADPLSLRAWNFDQRCEAAASLLRRTNVRRWLSRCYPLVLVDELQDVDDVRLEMIKWLTHESHVIVAADGFQDLRGTGDSPAVVWMREVSVPTVLTQCHRTHCTDLLTTADRLRNGQSITDERHCKILSAPSAAVGASFLACNLTWFGIAGTVVLSPAGPTIAPFVRGVVDRLRSGPISPGPLKGASVGPFRIDWESQVAADVEALMNDITFDVADDSIDTVDHQIPSDRPGGRELQQWVDSQRRVLGRQRLTRDEIADQAARICQQLRAARSTSDSRLVAMTIHQAKNREFDRVVVLWPYQVSGSAEAVRRLLYNAVTRARERVAIIVQNVQRDGRDRRNQPPFAGS